MGQCYGFYWFVHWAASGCVVWLVELLSLSLSLSLSLPLSQLSTYMHTCVWACAHVSACTHACVRVQIHTHTDTHRHTQTHTDTHTHTHTHTRTHTHMVKSFLGSKDHTDYALLPAQSCPGTRHCAVLTSHTEKQRNTWASVSFRHTCVYTWFQSCVPVKTRPAVTMNSCSSFLLKQCANSVGTCCV